ncbi:MAG: MATE family efflux transporter [Oscillospiraceae bacterium]
MSNKANRLDDRRSMMLDTPISRLIPKMAIPTVIAMLITSVYSMADSYFVHFLGTSATAAVGVNMSIDQTIMMAGSFLAVGSNSYISRLMGAKQNDKASATLSAAFFTAFFLGILVMVPGLMFTEKMVRLLGATNSSAKYAVDYANYILIAAPFMASSFVLNQCLRSEGSPVYSMVGMGLGGILNIALDPLFIFTFDMGVGGAALATAISKFISFCILIFPYIRKHSVLRLSIKRISFSRDIVRETTLMGMPSLLRTGLSVVSFIIINNFAGRYSDSALAGISVVTRIMMVPTFAILGFAQGFQPVAGYNFGATRYDRVKESFRFSSLVAVISVTVVSLLMAVFSKQLILLFTEGDMEMVKIGQFCLITQCVIMPLNAWVIIVNMLYAALGKPVGAIILGSTRQGICFLPVVFILPIFLGIYGLASAQAVADLLAFVVAIPFAISIYRGVNRKLRDELPLPEIE